MKALQEWLSEYAESHVHPTNINIHWLCIPLIFWSISGMLFLVTIPVLGNLALPVLVALTLYYLRLSKTLWIGMLLFGALCLGLNFLVFKTFYESSGYVFLGVFVLAWVGQFIGHKIEGRKPSFLKDLQFLLIGPAWLMAKLYRKAGIPL
ncbi:MAG: DUF962 domain-containing protein [Bacteroidia bacterium]|nr:DUF962 domain-containing protein [Bacteroidia bacterium]